MSDEEEVKTPKKEISEESKRFLRTGLTECPRCHKEIKIDPCTDVNCPECGELIAVHPHFPGTPHYIRKVKTQ